MTTDDEPYVPYRARYVAGLERQLADQREAMAQAMEALNDVEWTDCGYGQCPWCEALQYHEPHRDDCPREAALAVLRRVAALQLR